MKKSIFFQIFQKNVISIFLVLTNRYFVYVYQLIKNLLETEQHSFHLPPLIGDLLSYT